MAGPDETRLRWVGVAVCSALLATPMWAHAQDAGAPPNLPIQTLPPTGPRINTTGRTIELRVPLKEAGREIGSVLLRIGDDDALSVDADGVIALLADFLDPDVLESLDRAAVDGRLSPQSFDVAGLNLAFIPGLLELELTTPVDAIREQVLSFAADRPRPADLRPPEDISGYLNFLGGVSQTSDDENSGLGDLNSLLVDFEGALRTFGPVLESEWSLEDDDVSGNRNFFRRGSRLIYDDAPRAVRYGGGDLSVAGEGFQDTFELLGFAATRDFSLQPTRNLRPTGRRQFILERPSTVDVLVNGTRLRQLRLQPGTFDLRDIPLSTGANDIELIIEDDAGNVDRIALSSFFDFDLLDPGLVTFGFGAGVFRDVEDSEVRYDSDIPLATGFVRAGITQSITAGANAQASETDQQVGVEATLASPLGFFDIDVAGSHKDARGTGFAVGFDYEFPFADEDPANRRLVFGVESLSADFGGAVPSQTSALTAVDDAPLNDTRLDFSVDYSQEIFSDVSASVGANYAYGRGDTDDRFTVGANFSGRVRQSSWTLSLDYRDDGAEGSELGASVSFTVPLGRRQDFEVSVDTASEEVRSVYSFRDGSSRIGDFSVSAGVSRSEDDDAALEASADYVGNRFRAAVDHDTRLAADDSRLTVTRLRGETAIAFAGGKLAVGRPINDSFAIVTTHPSLEGRRVFVDPSDDGDLATTSALGAALVPDLTSYQIRQLDFDVADLPVGYDLGAGAFSIEPTYRSGFALEGGSAATVTMLGNLETADGEPVSLVSGQAVNLDDPDFDPVVMFTNRVGRFAISGIKPGQYELRLNDDAESVLAFEVPEGTIGLFRAGTLALPE